MAKKLSETHRRFQNYVVVAFWDEVRSRGPLPSLTHENAPWCVAAQIVVGVLMEDVLHRLELDKVEAALANPVAFPLTTEATVLRASFRLVVEEDRLFLRNRGLNKKISFAEDLDEILVEDHRNTNSCLRPAPNHLRQLYDSLDVEDLSDLEREIDMDTTRRRQVLLEYLREAYNQLPESERMIVQLRVFQGLGWAEIAKRIDRPLTTTWNTFARATRSLGRSLAIRAAKKDGGDSLLA